MAGALIEAIEGPAGGTGAQLKKLSTIVRPYPYESMNPGVGLDLTTLCIAKGKKCWQLYIDCVVLNDDGNALDALAAAVRVRNAHTPFKNHHEFLRCWLPVMCSCMLAASHVFLHVDCHHCFPAW